MIDSLVLFLMLPFSFLLLGMGAYSPLGFRT